MYGARNMECFAMNSKRAIMAAATAVLLSAATITTASAQGQERTNGRGAAPNVSTGAQMNGPAPTGNPGASAGQQFQGNAGQQF